jgi:glucosyl-3-phosphoglycerate phosphatase
MVEKSSKQLVLPPGLCRYVMFTRHGETDYNARDVVQGQSESQLSARGYDQVRCLGKGMSRMVMKQEIPPPGVVYSSDLDRATSTATHILDSLPRARYSTHANLRERNWGIWEGVVAKETPIVGNTMGVVDVPKGESLDEWTQRGIECIDNYILNVEHRVVVLNGHGGTNMLIMNLLLHGEPRKEMLGDNASMYAIQIKDGKTELKHENVTFYKPKGTLPARLKS